MTKIINVLDVPKKSPVTAPQLADFLTENRVHLILLSPTIELRS